MKVAPRVKRIRVERIEADNIPMRRHNVERKCAITAISVYSRGCLCIDRFTGSSGMLLKDLRSAETISMLGITTLHRLRDYC